MKEIKVRAAAGEFGKACDFIEKELQRSRISRQIISENMIVFEAIFNDIILKGFPEETQVKISIKNSFGNPGIKLEFPGERYIPIGGDSLEDSVEYKIIKAYEDKLEYTYRASYNIIRLTVKRDYATQAVLCAAGFLLAAGVYAVISHTVSPESREHLLRSAVMPAENIFTNAMLMIGTPMTFFSILKNLLETYIISERSSSARRLQGKTLITSATAVLLAVVLGFGVKLFSPYVTGLFGHYSFNIYTDADLPELVSSIMPSGIFEPFNMISPFPLIIIALLIVYALRSAGSQFDKLKSAVDACYMLFSRMLNLVMFFLPIFSFLAFLHILLERGFVCLKGVLFCWVAVLIGIVFLMLVYALRLKLGGIKVINFIRNITPILKENIKINSSIDAVPFNIRQCAKLLGIDRNYLEDSLPVLAQINLDGNCFIIMEITMVMLISTGTVLPWWNYLMLAVLVIFLSLGAPNQPGSILIGVLIIVNYLNVPSMMAVAIYAEVLLGMAQCFVNVTGDIVMAAIESRKAEKKLKE